MAGASSRLLRGLDVESAATQPQISCELPALCAGRRRLGHPKCGKNLRKIGRERALELHVNTRGRVLEAEIPGMKKWPSDLDHRSCTPIEVIADDGVTNAAEVNANLMGPAGFQGASHQRTRRGIVIDGDAFVVSSSEPPVLADRHEQWISSRSANRRVNGPAWGGKCPPDQRLVTTINLMAGELRNKFFVRIVGSCHHHQT